jgi:hypothetical protein
MFGVMFQCPCGKEYFWRHTLVSHQTWRCQTWAQLSATSPNNQQQQSSFIYKQWETQQRQQTTMNEEQKNFINEQWESTSAGGRILAGPDATYSVQDVRREMVVDGRRKRRSTLPLLPGAPGYAQGMPNWCFFQQEWPENTRFIWFIQHCR